jgi:hypothetical protein
MGFLFLSLAILVVFAIYVVASTTTKSSITDTSQAQAANFTGVVTRIYPINASLVSVSYLIRNTSKSLGLPDCNVYIQDPSGSFPGYNAHLAVNWTKPGMSTKGMIRVSVNNPGSRYVTQGVVNCN